MPDKAAETTADITAAPEMTTHIENCLRAEELRLAITTVTHMSALTGSEPEDVTDLQKELVTLNAEIAGSGIEDRLRAAAIIDDEKSVKRDAARR